MNDGEQLSTVFLFFSLILAICTNLNSYRLFLPPKSIKCQIEMLPKVLLIILIVFYRRTDTFSINCHPVV